MASKSKSLNKPRQLNDWTQRKILIKITYTLRSINTADC